jgi:hypothetical protein
LLGHTRNGALFFGRNIFIQALTQVETLLCDSEQCQRDTEENQETDGDCYWERFHGVLRPLS